MNDASGPAKAYSLDSVDMIVTELDSASEFLTMALESASQARIHKAREKAVHVCEMAVQFLAASRCVQADKLHVAKKLASMKSLLQEAGENNGGTAQV